MQQVVPTMQNVLGYMARIVSGSQWPFVGCFVSKRVPNGCNQGKEEVVEVVRVDKRLTTPCPHEVHNRLVAHIGAIRATLGLAPLADSCVHHSLCPCLVAFANRPRTRPRPYLPSPLCPNPQKCPNFAIRTM